MFDVLEDLDFDIAQSAIPRDCREDPVQLCRDEEPDHLTRLYNRGAKARRRLARDAR